MDRASPAVLVKILFADDSIDRTWRSAIDRVIFWIAEWSEMWGSIFDGQVTLILDSGASAPSARGREVVVPFPLVESNDLSEITAVLLTCALEGIVEASKELSKDPRDEVLSERTVDPSPFTTADI